MFTALIDALHSIEILATCVEYLSEEQLHLLDFGVFQRDDIDTRNPIVSKALGRLIDLGKITPSVQVV